MPAKSLQQYKFMKGVEEGSIKAPGLTPAKAAEYTSKNKGKMSPRNLPKISNMMKNKG